jgi:H+/Cl- antiporter ClcA
MAGALDCIGLVAGLGAIAFYLAIDWSTHFFLGQIVGYLPPSPSGEGAPVVRAMDRPWLLPIVVGLGGVLSGLMVFNLAPEAEGHGTDAAIAAIHHHQGRVRARIPPIKLVASAITIGSGGSGGREGPAAQISAGFGSLLGQWLKLKPLDRRIAVAAGMGAGIGAIFRAPLGGALMAAEILYLHDLEVEAIIPALIASIVGYTVYGAYSGIVGTSLSIGSGGSGGIFGPGMVIGGMLGATFWRLAYGALPSMPQTPAPFVIVGMMALFGGIAHAPLAVMLMVAEMTGNLSMLAPAMVAVGVSTALVGDNTIYRSQLANRARAPAHQVQFAFPLLSSLLVRDAMTPPRATVRLTTSARDALGQLTEQRAMVLAVVDEHDRFAGIVARPRLERVAEAERPALPVQHLLATHLEPLTPEQPLDDALEQLADHSLPWLPVVEGGRVVGGLGAREALRTYKTSLQRSARRTQSLPEDTSVFEVVLQPDSPIVGQPLASAGFPRKTLVVAIRRDGETIFPTARSRLEAGDVLTILADPGSEAMLQEFVGAGRTSNGIVP